MQSPTIIVKRISLLGYRLVFPQQPFLCNSQMVLATNFRWYFSECGSADFSLAFMLKCAAIVLKTLPTCTRWWKTSTISILFWPLFFFFFLFWLRRLLLITYNYVQHFLLFLIDFSFSFLFLHWGEETKNWVKLFCICSESTRAQIDDSHDSFSLADWRWPAGGAGGAGPADSLSIKFSPDQKMRTSCIKPIKLRNLMQSDDNNTSSSSSKTTTHGMNKKSKKKKQNTEMKWCRNVNHRGISLPPPDEHFSSIRLCCSVRMSLAIGILQQTELAFSLFNINRMATEIHPVSQSVSQSSYLLTLTAVLLAAGMCVMHCTRRKEAAIAENKYTPRWRAVREIYQNMKHIDQIKF